MKKTHVAVLVLIFSVLAFCLGSLNASYDRAESVTVENGVLTYKFTVTAKAIR